MLLKVILPSVVGVPELEFLYLRFSFWNLFFDSFQAFSKVSTLPKKIICGLGVLGLWLKFFNSKIFYGNALSLYLGRGDVSKTIALLSLVIYLSNVKSKLEAYFCLSFNHFLDYYFPDI